MINRKILASMLVIALVGAVAGSGTLAYFNDTEESTGNTFAAGQIDLKIDWDETYNGEFEQEQDPIDNPGPIFEFDDIKPGDHGEATISLDNEDGNPYWLWMSTDLPYNNETSVTEPEETAEGEENVEGGDFDPNDGELAENIQVRLWYDDGKGDGVREDNIYQEDEEIIYGGAEQVCEPGQSGESLDVALVLDGSGSMSSSDLTAAENGATSLVNDLDSQDQSAAVLFAENSELAQELTTDKSAVTSAIDGLDQIQDTGSTNMDAAIQDASNELQSSRAQSGSEKVMVILTDGRPTDGDAAESAAAAAKNSDIRIVTISLGTSSAPQVMQNIAGPEDEDTQNVYTSADSEELEGVFDQVSEGICQTQLGTLAGLHEEMKDGELLDGDTSDDVKSPFDRDTQYIGFQWNVSKDVGNEIQTDTAEFDLNFYAGQHRHNEDPSQLDNPFMTGSTGSGT